MEFKTPEKEEESPVAEAVDYINKQLWKENKNLDSIQDDVIAYAIREATLNQMDLCFKQPYSSFREYASRIRMGKGYLITENAVNELRKEL